MLVDEWQFTTNLSLMEATVQRLNHIEQLLLGLATLAIAGWGYLFATRTSIKSYQDEAAYLQRSLFVLLFSGLVGSAFSALYTGRMGINRALIALEDVLTPAVAPYRGFMQDTGFPMSLLVFGLPALFMPALAVGAIWSVLHETKSTLKDTSGAIRSVRVTGGIALAVVVVTTVASLVRVAQVVAFGCGSRR